MASSRVRVGIIGVVDDRYEVAFGQPVCWDDETMSLGR